MSLNLSNMAPTLLHTHQGVLFSLGVQLFNFCGSTKKLSNVLHSKTRSSCILGNVGTTNLGTWSTRQIRCIEILRLCSTEFNFYYFIFIYWLQVPNTHIPLYVNEMQSFHMKPWLNQETQIKNIFYYQTCDSVWGSFFPQTAQCQ